MVCVLTVMTEHYVEDFGLGETFPHMSATPAGEHTCTIREFGWMNVVGFCDRDSCHGFPFALLPKSVSLDRVKSSIVDLN